MTPGRAERETHRGFARARERARELQVRDVRARDEQHEHGHREEELQGLPSLLTQLPAAVVTRSKHDLLRAVFFERLFGPILEQRDVLL